VIAPEDRLSVKEAAEILGRTDKAVQQLIHRKSKGGVGLKSELDKSTGRRWTTRAWIIMLTWLWISGLALLFGAEVNAEAERSRELGRGRAR
jgi:hypothetical protein